MTMSLQEPGSISWTTRKRTKHKVRISCSSRLRSHRRHRLCLLSRGSWVRVPARSPPQTLFRQGFHHFHPASVSLRDFFRVTLRVTADEHRSTRDSLHPLSRTGSVVRNPWTGTSLQAFITATLESQLDVPKSCRRSWWRIRPSLVDHIQR